MADVHRLRLARWERIQARGLWRFALVQGVLLYGLSMWLIFAALGWARYTHRDWVRFIGIAFVPAIIGGFVFGICMYAITMLTYKRHRKHGE